MCTKPERVTEQIAYVVHCTLMPPPGSGKTFLLRHVCKYLRERTNVCDAQWELVSLAALRATSPGGKDIHDLFGFLPGCSNLWTTLQALASTAEQHLRPHPEKKRRLQELLFLFIDEFEQVGGSLLEAMNLVLQRVRGNNHPFCGVSVVAAGDHYRTEPIGMMPPYRFMPFRSHFQSLSLRQLYRARHDHMLQKAIEYMRIPVMTEEGVCYVTEHVHPPVPGLPRHGTACTHHNTADDVQRDAPDAVWLLSKKKAGNKARDAKYNDARGAK